MSILKPTAGGGAGLDVALYSLLSFFVLPCVSPEVTVTSLHPPRLCRIAVLLVNPIVSLSRVSLSNQRPRDQTPL